MGKPQTIERHLCNGKDKEEKYMSLTTPLDHRWGLRELNANFHVSNFKNSVSSDIDQRPKREIASIQALHYTVAFKLAGAFSQMETMEGIFSSHFGEGTGLDLRVLDAKEAFDALHGDLCQSGVCPFV